MRLLKDLLPKLPPYQCPSLASQVYSSSLHGPRSVLALVSSIPYAAENLQNLSQFPQKSCLLGITYAMPPSEGSGGLACASPAIPGSSDGLCWHLTACQPATTIPCLPLSLHWPPLPSQRKTGNPKRRPCLFWHCQIAGDQ